MGVGLEPKVERYELKQPLTYQRQKVRSVLYMQCREGDPELMDQFDYISHLLRSM